MGFVRQDDNTVVNEETGEAFFMPSLTSVGVNESATFPEQTKPSMAGLDAPPLQPETKDLVPQPQPDIPSQLPQTPSLVEPKFQAPTKAQLQGRRSDQILNDPVQFASEGGVVQSRNELAAMQGGQGRLREQAVVAEMQAKRTAQLQQSTKDTQLAGFIEQTAAELADRQMAIDSAARARVSERQKRVDELNKKTIDPSRGFHRMGTASKVMWVLGLLAASQTKNSSANVGMLVQAMDNMLNRDIAAQKADLAHQGDMLQEQTKLDNESTQLDLKGLSDWSAQRELRYKSLDRMLDAKIAQMGNQAAERAGLLKAKALVNEEILKGQATFQTQVQAEAEAAKGRAHTAYMARLNHSLRMQEKAADAELEEKKAAREREDKTGEKGILSNDPAGAPNNLGLVTVDKKTGKPVQVTIRGRTNKDAVEAEEKLALGNKASGLYKILLRELDGMDQKDIAGRHFSAEFRATSKELAEMLAKIHNDRITDRDVTNAAEQLLGIDTVSDGIINGTIGVIKAKGDAAEGAKDVLKRRIASHEGLVTEQVLRHVDARDKANFDITFKPNEVIKEPAEGKKSYNETIAELGGGADVADLQKRDKRLPVTGDVADKLLKLEGPAGTATEKQYVNDRDQGRLPRLPATEQERVDQFREELKQSTPDRILAVSQAVRRGIEKKPVSDEARFQLVMEARLALRDSMELEDQVRVGQQYVSDREAIVQGGARRKSGKKGGEGYFEEVAEILASDAYKEARKRAGLVRDVGE